MTTGSRTEKASKQVTPPAFWISTSEAAIRSGIRSVQPSTLRLERERSLLRCRSSDSLRAATTIAW